MGTHIHTAEMASYQNVETRRGVQVTVPQIALGVIATVAVTTMCMAMLSGSPQHVAVHEPEASYSTMKFVAPTAGRASTYKPPSTVRPQASAPTKKDGATMLAAGFSIDEVRRDLGDDAANKLLAAQTVDGPERDVALYGFGRIGRLLARILTSQPSNLKIKAIVVRPVKNPDLKKRAELLLRDSVHGMFSGSVDIDEASNSLIVNGHKIKVMYAGQPEDVDYEAAGLKDVFVIDNTGVWRDEEGLSRHLTSKGASQVLLTAPAKGAKNTSAASCTTNAVVPVLKVIQDKFKIDNGHLETVHSFTNDQNLIDNYHKADRRGRAAPMNMVISETGAGKAVQVALPELAGKLTSNAIRVPTPDVSIAVLMLNLETETTKEGLNAAFKEASETYLKDQLGYSDSGEAVSQDFIGTSYSSVVDSLATQVVGKRAVVYVWYDNENGYSNQVVRVVETLTKL